MKTTEDITRLTVNTTATGLDLPEHRWLVAAKGSSLQRHLRGAEIYHSQGAILMVFRHCNHKSTVHFIMEY